MFSAHRITPDAYIDVIRPSLEILTLFIVNYLFIS
jgi:hypothetical protein